MNTQLLIRALAADHATRAISPGRLLWHLLAGALLVSTVVFGILLGPRADIAEAMNEPRFIFKFVVTLALALSAGTLLLRLARPGTPVPLAWLATSPLLLVASTIAEIALTPSGLWMTKLVGSNASICLTMVPLLSAPLLVAALLTLRHGAPTRPLLAGALAGLLAGGLGATLYAAHCTDDSPLFVATWYTLAIALVTLMGTAVGYRLLRW
jgi:hypothetical protein